MRRRRNLPTSLAALVAFALLAAFASHVSAAPIDGFTPAPHFGEQQRAWSGDGVRAIINAPGDFDATKATRLIVYACPNGNTIEQTLGATLEPHLDWHFDIQHVAAQVRKLRQLDPNDNIVLACIEAEKLSFPAWRKSHHDNATRARDIVNELSRALQGQAPPVPPVPVRLTLAAHSGGGSFVFAYINGGDAIPDTVERLAWLDANYAYDETELHPEKLLAWLKGAGAAEKYRRLIVIAYDDSRVTLNGKPVLKSPMGGTFGSSKRMIERLRKDVPLEESARGPFTQVSGMNGRILFLIHPNPQKKILHTVLVERNGLLEALTLGTPLEGKWGGEFWGTRAYANLIAPAPAPPSASPASSAPAATEAPANHAPGTTRSTAASQPAGIPPRPANAAGGRAFMEEIDDLPAAARDAAIVDEILRGNLPDFLRTFAAVTVDRCTYEVMRDYLAIGSDADFVRVPMTPQSATRIAAAFGCSLPTRKMVNDIWSQAELKLDPRPMTERREAAETFVAHDDLIEQVAKHLGVTRPPCPLSAGHKKDLVLTNRLKEKPNRVAIYGWHKPDGKPIQPLYVGHADHYVDYSHGVRLVKRALTLDGHPADLDEVLRDPARCAPISDEGAIDARYR